MVIDKGKGLMENSGEEQMVNLKRICIFCGSRSGKQFSFSDAARELGKEMV